jgi:DNA polymerase theta
MKRRHAELKYVRPRDASLVPAKRAAPNDDIKSLAYHGMPQYIVDNYAQKGVKELFNWQAECLSLQKVQRGGNIVYSAPTSGGKTLVAEILMIRNLIKNPGRNKKVLFIMPYKSLVREKAESLKILVKAGRGGGQQGRPSPLLYVARVVGGHTPTDLYRANIICCTPEKANHLIDQLFHAGTIHELGAVVVDELQNIGDPTRGHTLEILLATLRQQQVQEQAQEPARARGGGQGNDGRGTARFVSNGRRHTY